MSHSEATVSLSPIVYGGMRVHEWNVGVVERRKRVTRIIDVGCTTFDHADIYGGYGNESLFGEVIQQDPAIRKRIQIVTKCGIQLISSNRPQTVVKHYDSSEAHIIASVENSLRNLHTDWIDVLLIHRPDFLMHPAAVAGAFQKLYDGGKVLHFGVSNFLPSQVQLLAAHVAQPLEFNQVEFSPLHVEPLLDGTFDQCLAANIRPMAWSPFASGAALDGARQPELVKTIGELAEKYRLAPEGVVASWLVRHPAGPVPVVGTSRLEKLEQMVVGTRAELDVQDWYRILEAARGHEVA